jgi:hypothetical protein
MVHVLSNAAFAQVTEGTVRLRKGRDGSTLRLWLEASKGKSTTGKPAGLRR